MQNFHEGVIDDTYGGKPLQIETHSRYFRLVPRASAHAHSKPDLALGEDDWEIRLTPVC